MCFTLGVALEHTAALRGNTVNPLARSDTDRDKMKSAVQSPRNSAYLRNTAIRTEFATILQTVITLITPVLMSVESIRSMMKLSVEFC